MQSYKSTIFALAYPDSDDDTSTAGLQLRKYIFFSGSGTEEERTKTVGEMRSVISSIDEAYRVSRDTSPTEFAKQVNGGVLEGTGVSIEGFEELGQVQARVNEILKENA